MSVQVYAVIELESLYGHSHRFTWSSTTAADTGLPVSMPASADRSVAVSGTFGTGGSVTIEGSNDNGTTWFTLHDPLGNALTFTSAGLKQVAELTGLIRPNYTAGTGFTIAVDLVTTRRG